MTEFNGPRSLERMGAVGQVITYVRQAIQAGKYNVGDKRSNGVGITKKQKTNQKHRTKNRRCRAALALPRDGGKQPQRGQNKAKSKI